MVREKLTKCRSEFGQGLVEYAGALLIVAAVLALVLTNGMVKNTINNLFSRAASTITSAAS